MEKIIGTFEYGLCVFSLDTMTKFLEAKKIRSKKVLALLQKKKDIYLDSIKGGAWMPIPSINSGTYVIGLEGYDDSFGDGWKQVLTYFSSKEQWHRDLDGHVTHSAYWYDVPEGKYLLTVTGFARKKIVDNGAANYGFQFKLTKVEEFKEARNPREEAYEFNIEWLHTSQKAVVHWLPKKESGVKWPLEKEEYGKSIVIPLEDDKKAYLRIKFDISKQTEENTNNCRVETWFKTPKDFELESGKEYPVYEGIYKRGKTNYKELGKIRIN